MGQPAWDYDKLLWEYERLKDALEKYGKHILDCKINESGVCICTCGFEQALQGE